MIDRTGWPTAVMRQRRADLITIAKTLRQLSWDNGVVPHMSRYLVVRSAGYLESTRDDCIRRYCQDKAAPTVASHVASFLGTGRGVRPQQLRDSIASFSRSWADDFDAFSDGGDQKRRSELGALVLSRKKIAHGEGETVTMRRALGWSDTALEIADWMIQRYGPTSPP